MDRREIYKKIEEKRGNPLIVYVTSVRPGVGAVMGVDSITEIIRQINLIPKEKKNIDFMIISNGGDPICSLRIINILRERFNKVNVLVPYVAYSAATLLSLGADEIVMHPFSNLGPVDPQMVLTQKLQNGQVASKSFAAEDLKNYFKFVKDDVGLTDQNALANSFQLLSSEISPISIGAAKRSSQLSISLSEKLLSYHMKDANKASTISKSLMTSFYHHGYAVSRKEAKNIGLNVLYPDEELEQLMWEVWLSFEQEMKANKPFIPENELNELNEYNIFLQNPQLVANTFKISVFIGCVDSLRAISKNEDDIQFICQKVQGQINCLPNRNIKGWNFHTISNEVNNDNDQ